MPRYNLREYSDDHANAQGSLHQYARNKPNIGDDAAMAAEFCNVATQNNGTLEQAVNRSIYVIL